MWSTTWETAYLDQYQSPAGTSSTALRPLPVLISVFEFEAILLYIYLQEPIVVSQSWTNSFEDDYGQVNTERAEWHMTTRPLT
jgi:hypothetical protein